jgi:CheY-like chemotaxis protein
MDPSFVREKLGEPWAKEDNYTTGSGLSVHLAYRIIDLMGGHMEITSGQGQGCTVLLEVPLPVRQLSLPSSPRLGSDAEPTSPTDPLHLAVDPDHMHVGRKVGFAGFDPTDQNSVGLPRLGACLDRQFKKLGCEIVGLDEAELVVMDGRMEESEKGIPLLKEIKTDDIVFCVAAEHEAHPEVLAAERRLGKSIRRFRKPATPSMLRECLFPGHSEVIEAEIPQEQGGVKRSSISSPDQVDSHGKKLSLTHSRKGSEISSEPSKPRAHFSDSTPITPQDAPVSTLCAPRRLMANLGALWKPKGMPVEEAVASLCLGDYFSARKLTRTSSNTSSGAGTGMGAGRDTSESSFSTPQTRSEEFEQPTPSPSVEMKEHVYGDGDEKQVEEGEEEEEEVPEELIKVMVVEDNMINRKILVKILSSKLPIEVLEAEDGAAAVDLFKDLTSPIIGGSGLFSREVG